MTVSPNLEVIFFCPTNTPKDIKLADKNRENPTKPLFYFPNSSLCNVQLNVKKKKKSGEMIY